MINRLIRYPAGVFVQQPSYPRKFNSPIEPSPLQFVEPPEMGAGSHVDFGGLTLIYQVRNLHDF